jgi:hypothetical protein
VDDIRLSVANPRKLTPLTALVEYNAANCFRKHMALDSIHSNSSDSQLTFCWLGVCFEVNVLRKALSLVADKVHMRKFLAEVFDDVIRRLLIVV